MPFQGCPLQRDMFRAVKTPGSVLLSLRDSCRGDQLLFWPFTKKLSSEQARELQRPGFMEIDPGQYGANCSKVIAG